MLLSTVSLPAQHVHPGVRAAGENVSAAQADLEELRAKINTRRAEYEELKVRLAQGSRGKAAPELTKAAHELTQHQALTNLLEGDIPNAEQAVRDALAAFAASLHEFGAEWNRYLYAAGQKAVEVPVGSIRELPAWLGELQLIDGLMSREGILHIAGESNVEIAARFDRSQRSQSLARIIGGEDRGSEGRQMGVLELVHDYAARFTPPPPPEPDPEAEPLAVRLQRGREGSSCLTRGTPFSQLPTVPRDTPNPAAISRMERASVVRR
jgi:hypothetical protein